MALFSNRDARGSKQLFWGGGRVGGEGGGGSLGLEIKTIHIRIDAK